MRRKRASFSAPREHVSRTTCWQRRRQADRPLAFGVVLREMLTGRPAFEGETVSHVIAAVLKDQPDWSALPPTVPAFIHKLLRRSVEKDRKRGLDSASAARLDIDDTIATRGLDAGVTDVHHAPSSRGRTSLLLAAAFAIGGVVTGLVVWTLAMQSPTPQAPDVVRFGIHDTDGLIVSGTAGDIALSPDRRTGVRWVPRRWGAHLAA